MHARVSMYSGEAEGLVDGFQSAVGPLEEIDGFVQAYFLVDRANDKAISITVWENEGALQVSAARADELRKGAAEPAGATIDSVENYEIALTASGKKTALRR
jgi:heme-degrading monooxygenase HmoA